MTTLVLVVDDEPAMLKVSEMTLTQAGYNVLTLDDPLEALEEIREGLRPDVIVSDVSMPQLDGFQFYERVREVPELRAVPFLFLTALEDRQSMRRGMTLGADDYLTKPVSPQVIVAHVKAVLRRTGVEESRTLSVRNLMIYEDEYRATLDGKDLGLTLTEFELLRYLVRHPRKAFTRQQLLETIWQDAMMVTERTVDAHIKNLREKLGGFAQHIQTVRGVGYRFVEDGSNSE